MGSMQYVPKRGRIIIVNFELAGQSVPPEMRKAGRPCVVFQNNSLARGDLVTVVPLSTQAPLNPAPCHHRMDHRSFLDMPQRWRENAANCWAKCDYVATISLSRCLDPYYKDQGGIRRHVRCKAIQADMEAIENAVLWGLGVDLGKRVTVLHS
jgi:uncharacterized protein YifN (PemK superfamily)